MTTLHSHSPRPLRRRRKPARAEPSLGERLDTLTERLTNILETLSKLLALGESRAAPWRHG